MATDGSGTHRIAARAARNTALRAAAELGGKVASLVLVFALAHEVGASGLGVYVFAAAWAELSMVVVEMGFDRYFLRRVAAEPAALDDLFFNVLALKLRRAVPVVAVSVLALNVIDFSATQRQAVYLVTLALLLDGVSQTAMSGFAGLERGGLAAAVVLVQRLLLAALGLTALALGHGVVTVTAAWAVSTGVASVLALWLARRAGHARELRLDREQRRAAGRSSLAFAAQELFATGIARADAVLLAALASAAVVGLYGAAYRMLESTLFLPLALQTAFAAMFTYLAVDGEPPVRAAYQRSVKLALALLVPCAVAFFVLAEPLVRVLFGAGFGGAVTPLRILAPAVVVLGLVLLSTSLIISRRDPRVMVPIFGVALAINVALNAVLIPLFDATGAAAAMLATEAGFAVVAVRLATATVGPLDPLPTAGGPLLAGAVMAVPMALLSGSLALALPAGAITYAAALVAAERQLSPDDLRFAIGLIRRRLPSRGEEMRGVAHDA